MVKETALLLFITILLFFLFRMNRNEGFTDTPRMASSPAWEKLSDDQVLELYILFFMCSVPAYIVDPKNDSNLVKALVEMPKVLPPRLDEVPFKPADLKVLRNKIMNKAAEDKDASILFNIVNKRFSDILKISKAYHKASSKEDKNMTEVSIEDAKKLAKPAIKELKEKVPDFPFNPDIKKQMPELFEDAPKPSASECKRYFKCSSIYAA